MISIVPSVTIKGGMPVLVIIRPLQKPMKMATAITKSNYRDGKHIPTHKQAGC